MHPAAGKTLPAGGQKGIQPAPDFPICESPGEPGHPRPGLGVQVRKQGQGRPGSPIETHLGTEVDGVSRFRTSTRITFCFVSKESGVGISLNTGSLVST